MVAKPCVLIVDSSEETREVLRTALGACGMAVLEATGPQEGLRLARSSQPNVVVLDLEWETTQAEAIAEDFHDLQPSPPALVVLGTARQAQQPAFVRQLSGHEFVRKPYHYGPLIRKIEQLLAGHEQATVRRAA